jgi:hypothetical protein
MDKTELVVIFSDGYVSIGEIHIRSVGTIISIDSLIMYSKDRKWLQVENGWLYNVNQIIKMKDCTMEEILQLKRDYGLTQILDGI